MGKSEISKVQETREAGHIDNGIGKFRT